MKIDLKHKVIPVLVNLFIYLITGQWYNLNIRTNLQSVKVINKDLKIISRMA